MVVSNPEGDTVMKYKEVPETEPKKRSRAGLAVLVIFLILAGAVGYLYYSVCKAPDPVKQAFTRSVDLEKSYVLGMLMDSVDGEPYLMYETEYSDNGLYHRAITQVKLTEEEAKALQIPGKIGVWKD